MPLMEQRISLLHLPNELLESILALLPLKSLVAAQSSCTRLAELAAEPLLWRQHCISAYRFWDDKHRFKQRQRSPATETNWKQLLTERKIQDRHVLRTLDKILESRLNRFETMQAIVGLGYDAKDILLEESKVPEDAGDVLARTYWCNEALGCVERSQAIKMWERLANGEDIPLEQALLVYDLFTATRPPQTFAQISDTFTNLTNRFRTENPEPGSPRDTAIALIDWLRKLNYLGLDDSSDYYNLQNNLISIALADHPGHPSLPIISVAIFCCFARRLGLNAHPCGLPSHVIAIVESQPGYTLDGHPTNPSDPPERIYLDPFTDSNELAPATLRVQLAGYGITHPSEQALFLSPLSPKDMITRISRNISHSRRFAAHNPPEGDHPTAVSGTISLSRPAARYAAAWATVLFTASPQPGRSHQSPSDFENMPRQQDLLEALNLFLPALEPRFAVDLPLVHKHILPLIPASGLRDSLLQLLDNIGEEDTRPLNPQPRVGVAANKVKHRVGTVFEHRRFGYTAVIVGWDTKCAMKEQWIQQMRVDSLPGGRDQCFYHSVVAGDESVRYVAEENIEVLGELREMPEGLGRVAGKWFRRWDGGEGRYVSNVREEFPDD